ncbi:FecR domain-containing protein, partial [Chloroflexota bacterium]
MKADLTKILDDCIEQIRNGETIETCLVKYPDMREKLEPLLDMVLSICSLPTVTLPDSYVRVSKARLMTRITKESSQAKAKYPGQRTTLLDEIALAWQRLWHANTVVRKIAIPVILALLITLGASIFGVFNLLSPHPVLVSQCTLSILSGSVEVQNPGSDTAQQGTDGMTLNAGARVKTAPHSHVLLTFFEGSTVKLEPNTDVEIRQVEYSNEQSTTIVVKQWLGRTWSRVIKMADSGSHYQIETPSASAVVRGTLFTTEVEETGFTKVATTEGLVSVAAHDEEVYVPANQQTQVETGVIPTQPVTVPEPKSEIIITIGMPAVGSVSDPTGSSTGILASGLSFNQIIGSQSSSPSEGDQIITIVEPKTGEYTLTMRYVDEGKAPFSIRGKSEDKVTFNYSGNWDAEKESGWMIHLSLRVDDGVIFDGEVTSAEPLGDKAPEKIVEPKLAKDGFKLTEPPTKDRGQDKDEDEDVGQDKDVGQ